MITTLSLFSKLLQLVRLVNRRSSSLDYQVLVEADFLVNYFEDDLDKKHIRKSAEKIFKTETGKKIVKEMFFPETFQKSETWAQDALQDLEDFIEEQGIYIRQ